ncbi:MAG: DUF1573 domain-containing protein [Thermodesulfobacteriota bacterium]|nr:DUF1573 domain-containing protein [Thermodesulfobacteriota bacterium]
MAFFLLLSFSCPVFAAPSLVVEHLTHDFGEIIQGVEASHVFRFHNAGDQVLELGRLRSSCGCTVALLTARRLMPGDMGELQLVFSSEGFRGAVQKTVTFETNDPRHRVVTFSLRGKVKAELFLQPQRINWGVVKKNSPLQAELEIVNDSARTITLQNPQVTSAGIEAVLSALIMAPGERVQLKVSAEFMTGKKRLAGYILIKSDFPNLPQLKVPVSARLSKKQDS